MTRENAHSSTTNADVHTFFLGPVCSCCPGQMFLLPLLTIGDCYRKQTAVLFFLPPAFALFFIVLFFVSPFLFFICVCVFIFIFHLFTIFNCFLFFSFSLTSADATQVPRRRPAGAPHLTEAIQFYPFIFEVASIHTI